MEGKKKLGRGTEALRGCNRTKSDKSGFCMALEYFYHFFKASGFRDFLTRWQRKLSPKHTIFLQVRDWWKQRGSQRSGEWEDGPEQTEPVRQDGLAEKESKWDRRRGGRREDDGEKGRGTGGSDGEHEEQLAYSWWLLNHCVSPLLWEVRGAAPLCSSSPLSLPVLGSSRLLYNKAGRGKRGGKRSNFKIYLSFQWKWSCCTVCCSDMF